MYSFPRIEIGMSWSPIKSAQPPYGVPCAVSSESVTLIGLSETIAEPDK